MPHSQTNDEIGPGVVNFDFERWFPHIFWVSQWTSDDSYPDGYCYKVFSVRDESSRRAEVVVLLTERNGNKQEMNRFSIPLADVRGAAQIFLNSLSKRFGLDFEEQDFSAIRTFEDYEAATKKYGWKTKPNATGNA